jgi:hypothetical protein
MAQLDLSGGFLGNGGGGSVDRINLSSAEDTVNSTKKHSTKKRIHGQHPVLLKH